MSNFYPDGVTQFDVDYAAGGYEPRPTCSACGLPCEEDYCERCDVPDDNFDWNDVEEQC